MNYINVLAILISPALAVLISLWLLIRKEKQQKKYFILSSLMAARHYPVSDENVRALNMIDMIFHDKKGVRKLWHEYFDMLKNEGLNNPSGW